MVCAADLMLYANCTVHSRKVLVSKWPLTALSATSGSPRHIYCYLLFGPGHGVIVVGAGS